MYPKLLDYLEEARSQFDIITSERKHQLLQLADYIGDALAEGRMVNLTFICTHNSRRSHMGQLWLQVAVVRYGLGEFIRTFSGGTEATAFNPRAVATLRRAGFQIEDPGGDNPHYQVRHSDELPPIVCFSKKYDHPANPSQNFAAVMTCSDADQECPFIPGAAFRIPITYEDPKQADGTPEESARYDERSRQIAREMLFVMSEVKRKRSGM